MFRCCFEPPQLGSLIGYRALLAPITSRNLEAPSALTPKGTAEVQSIAEHQDVLPTGIDCQAPNRLET